MKNRAASTNRPQGLLKEPRKLRFLPWCAWADRKPQADLWAGIYVLGRIDSPPDPAKAPSFRKLPKEILYVGMSKNFNNRPAADHEGVKRYRELYGDADLKKLYVSVCRVVPVGCSNFDLLYALLEHLETKVQWDYTRKHEQLPLLRGNKKRSKRKAAERKAA